MTIDIEQDRCIECGKCARVCPAGTISRRQADKQIQVQHIESCIACGHCVAVCPTDSVRHSRFPAEKVHAVDCSQLPTPEQVALLIRSRRSNRALTAKPIPEHTLRQIAEAAAYAPTASNTQQVSVAVRTDPHTLRQVSDLTIGTFDSAIKKLNFPLVRWLLRPFLREVYGLIPAFRRYKQQHEEGGDPILRKATALLVFHTPKSSEFGCQDAHLAYQNASLTAQSLGVSQIYMGFVMRAIGQGRRKAFARLLGVEGEVQAVMALGLPMFRYAKYVERTKVEEPIP